MSMITNEPLLSLFAKESIPVHRLAFQIQVGHTASVRWRVEVKSVVRLYSLVYHLSTLRSRSNTAGAKRQTSSPIPKSTPTLGPFLYPETTHTSSKAHLTSPFVKYATPVAVKASFPKVQILHHNHASRFRSMIRPQST